MGQLYISGTSAAQPGRQIGQRHPPEKIQIDAGSLGAQSRPECFLTDLLWCTRAGQGVGQGVGEFQEETVQSGVVVLDAGAALRREDHHADRTGQGALTPVPQHLTGRDRRLLGKDGLQAGQQMAAAGGAVHIELRTAQQIQRRQGQQYNEHVLPPLDEGALFLISHGQVPQWAARCGWWYRDPAGPPGQ